MRLVLAFAAAQSLGLFLNSEAFAPSSFSTSLGRRTASSSLRIGGDVSDWDNDDFLESLAGKNPTAKGGDDEIPDDSIDGAELTPEMRAKMKRMNEEDEFGGGTRFKELLAAAQRSEPEKIPKALKNPFAENPFIGIPGLDPTLEEETPDLNPEEMTVEEQAEMFRKMMAGELPPPGKKAASIQLPQPRRPKPDAKTGRNRDADAIQNTADVYFAQLKRDSTVRNIARIRGDEDQANAVFADPKIEELKSLISENPHLA